MRNRQKIALSCLSAIALSSAFLGIAIARGTSAEKMQPGQVTRKLLGENAKLTVTDVIYRPGDTGTASSKENIAVYVVQGGMIERTFADGSKEVGVHKTGETLLISEKRPYSTKNIGKTTLHEIVIRPK